MRKSVKAALLSGLVFPGTGHFSLNRYPRGLIFFLPSFISLTVLIHYALSRAYAVADQIELGQIQLDTVAITNLISAPPTGIDFYKIHISTWILIICWIAGTIDSFILGLKVDHLTRK